MSTSRTPSPSRRPQGRLRTAALLLSTALVALPASAQDLQRKAPDGTWMRLVESRDGHLLETSNGATQVLPLASGTVLNDLRQQGERYWITGVEKADGPQLVLLEGRDRSLTRGSQLPTVQKARAWEPTLLLGVDGPETLLWFESDGTRDQVLLTARQVDGAWTKPEVISPRRTGSQMALTATRLNDGTLLAAWAAFDGQDTDILYSHRTNGTWSTPQPVTAPDPHNDITPKLLTTQSGALLAWSRATERQYQVLLVRYHAGTWQPPLTLGAPGTIYPTFQAGPEPVLLFQHAAPSAWEVLRLSPNGGLRDRGKIVTDRNAVPLVESLDGEGALLNWPAEGAEKVAGRERVVWER